MKVLSKDVYNRIRRHVYLYARHLDVVRWRYHFEGGGADDVADALSFYQNEDGGFGRGVEPDCQNPNSQPIQYFWGAAGILEEIGLDRPDSPMMKKFLNYIENCPDITDRGIRAQIPSNNDYPCNFWYLYQPEKAPPECNINSGVGFIFGHFPADSRIYQKALNIAGYRLSVMRETLAARLDGSDDIWQGLEPSDYASLIHSLDKHRIKTAPECRALYNQLLEIVKEFGSDQIYETTAKKIDNIDAGQSGRALAPDELDAIIDKLCDGERLWNNGARLREGEDNSKKFAAVYNVGMWWVITDAINDLKILKSHGRLAYE